jgi:hypothetical protein
LGSLDAEHETLGRLEDLRAAVSGRMQSVGVAALRAAWSAVFDDVKVTPTADESVVSLVPHIRREMLDFDDQVEGRLSGSPRRTAVSLPVKNSTGTQVLDQMITSSAYRLSAEPNRRPPARSLQRPSHHHARRVKARCHTF